MLRALDLCLLNASLVVGLTAGPRALLPLSLETFTEHVIWYVLLSGLWLLFAQALECYDLRVASSLPSAIRQVAQAVFLVAVLYFFAPYFSAPLTSSRLAWAIFAGSALLSIALWRAVYALFIVQPRFEHRMILVGVAPSVYELVGAISHHLNPDYQLIGIFCASAESQSQLVVNVEVLNVAREKLPAFAKMAGATDVVLDTSGDYLAFPELTRAIIACREAGLQVTTINSLYEQLARRILVQRSGQALHTLYPLENGLPLRFYDLAKRGVDVLCALVGLGALVLLAPIISLAIFADGRGPILYRQKRVGRSGRIFELLKFRTMSPDAEKDGVARWATADDDRITRGGRYLRRTRLDELPQLWNVLKGEMSMVGPRPERPEFVCQLDQQIPFFRLRHAVLPGLTGWAQVNYGYGSSTEDALVKLEYDLYYIKHRSLYLDLVILLKTLGVVLKMKGT